MGSRLIKGKGINDASYAVKRSEDTGDYYPSGKKKYKVIWNCPYYMEWTNMLARCYSSSYQKRSPTYIGCTVCESWLLFSSFRGGWMSDQDWTGNQLDKDLLVEGNKVYSQLLVFLCVGRLTIS